VRILQRCGFCHAIWAAFVILIASSGCEKGSHASSQVAEEHDAPADIGGTWLPDVSRLEAWPAKLALTPAARSMMDNFTPSARDPTTLCMPLGTPRNMLQTEYPLEIVQTPQRVFIVIQPNLANTEVRRVTLDGSALPVAPDASWYGTSRGRWEGSTLVVETIGLRADSLISGNGLAHSEELRVIERLSVVKDAEHGKALLDEIELRDPKTYQVPLKTRRYFTWAPQAQLRDGSCVELLWIDKLWRDRLRDHAEAARKTGVHP
jgi:hypothetical protein